MHRRFITLIVSAAIAVTSLTAQPVQAGDDDIAKWIAGAAALAIIGAAVADRNDSKRKKRHFDNGGHTGKVITYPRVNRNLLPGQCRVERRLQGNTIRGFARGCLRRNNVDVRALPRECAIRFRNRQSGRINVLFGGRCLRSYGYRVARH